MGNHIDMVLFSMVNQNFEMLWTSSVLTLVLWPWTVALKFFYWITLIFNKCHGVNNNFHIGSKHKYLISMQLNDTQILTSDTLLRFQVFFLSYCMYLFSVKLLNDWDFLLV